MTANPQPQESPLRRRSLLLSVNCVGSTTSWEQWTELVLSDTIVRVEYTGFSWTAGARKHRVSRSQVHHVVAQAELYFIRPAAPPGQPDEALLFLGDDQEGTRLEVVGVELADGRLRVIHAMAMRTGYKGLYEEARTWRE